MIHLSHDPAIISATQLFAVELAPNSDYIAYPQSWIDASTHYYPGNSKQKTPNKPIILTHLLIKNLDTSNFLYFFHGFLALHVLQPR